jgi:peroxiredoxin
MKRGIQSTIVMIMILTGFACSNNKTEIKGIVSGGAGKTLTLERLDVNRTTVIDTVLIRKDDSFSIRMQQDEAELFVIKNQQGKIINLLLSPGEDISLLSDYDSFGNGYQISGSDESEGISLLVDHLNKTRRTLDSLLLLVDAIDDPENPQLGLVRTAYAQTIIKQKRFTIKYLVENMTSLSSVYALYQKYDEQSLILGSESDLQYFKTVADSLDQVYPNSSLTKSLRADIKQRESDFQKAMQLNQLLEMADEETGFLELSIPDREGNEISLSALKGKVILVTFWASRSEESIKALLQLRSTYKKYHSAGFEIYAISLDNNKINWMNAMDFNEFEWINVSELSFPESRASLLYNVSAIPSTFLVNREGDIVAKNLFGRTLETWLDNII